MPKHRQTHLGFFNFCSSSNQSGKLIMQNNNVTNLLKYANVQMAAESMFGVNPSGSAGTTTGASSMNQDSLTRGNVHTSKFTDAQATQFMADGWIVLEHKANTSTGFSGTLFKYNGKADEARGLVPGELVLSLRSTEFIDDAARDNQATNSLEIKEFGWAFGQIADMEDWYASLKSRGLASAPVTVTGYSLGGHLATAFNLIRVQNRQTAEVAATYTFNGAGTGRVKNNTAISWAISQFNGLRSPNMDLWELFTTNPAVADLYESLRLTLRDGGLPTAAQRAAIAALTPPRIAVTPVPGLPNAPLTYQPKHADPQAQMLIDAFRRVDLIQQEMARVATLTSGSSDPANQRPTTPPASQVEATNINYQLAVLFASQNTSAVGLLAGGWQAVNGRQAAMPGRYLSNFYDVYGDTSPSAVSNSQLHHGRETPIFIEDQPLLRGNVLIEAAQQTYGYHDVKLLVPGYANNDFGDTHSLVLLVDSLSVQTRNAKSRTNGGVGVMNCASKRGHATQKCAGVGSVRRTNTANYSRGDVAGLSCLLVA
jgi:hypothetical protein